MRLNLLSYKALCLGWLFDQFYEEVVYGGSLDWPALRDGARVKALPERASMASPPRPVRHEAEIELLPGTVAMWPSS